MDPQHTSRTVAVLANFVGPTAPTTTTTQRSVSAEIPTAAASPAAADDSLVRRKLEKFGGAIAPDVVTVKPHVRAAPGAAGKEKLPVTAEVIVREYGKNERQTTHRALFVGGLVDSWIRRQPERPADEQLDRASAIRILRRKLQDARVDRRSCRIDRDLRCFIAARILGGDAQSLSISSIREISPLIGREGQRWHLVEAYAEKAKELWAAMLAEHLSADVVRSRVRLILPAKAIAIRRRKIKLSVLLKALPRFSPAELATLASSVERLRAGKGTSPAAA